MRAAVGGAVRFARLSTKPQRKGVKTHATMRVKTLLFGDVVRAVMFVAGVMTPVDAAETQQAAVGGVAAVGTSAEPLTPIAPETVTRDDAGRVVVRAIRLTSPIRVDGKLDEAVYGAEHPISGFLQSLPREGEPATERTDAWVMFDGESIYVAGRCWDSAPPDQWIANDMRRDSQQLRDNDNFGVMFDTFYDHRNGVLFQTNPLGALREQAIADGQYIERWNTVWQVKSARFEGGWSAEMVIPFKSLRYRDTGPQVWGINFRRVIRWKNEFAGVTLVPAAFGSSGLGQMQVAATLVGLDLPPARSRNLELKPYAVSASTTDATAAVPFRNDFTKDVGVDLKYGLSRQPDRGRDGEHRLRTDRRGPAAGEPDPLQPAVSRETRFLPRGSGDIRLRRPQDAVQRGVHFEYTHDGTVTRGPVALHEVALRLRARHRRHDRRPPLLVRAFVDGVEIGLQRLRRSVFSGKCATSGMTRTVVGPGSSVLGTEVDPGATTTGGALDAATVAGC